MGCGDGEVEGRSIANAAVWGSIANATVRGLYAALQMLQSSAKKFERSFLNLVQEFGRSIANAAVRESIANATVRDLYAALQMLWS